MTKITILGQEPTQKKELKPIKMVKCLQTLHAEFTECRFEKSEYSEIKLLSTSQYKGFDLFLCISNKYPSDGQIWLGHFNDGIV